jgi:hypothetical protein
MKWEWEDYRKVFLNYQQTASETILISLVTEEILKDFPKNIPKNVGTPAFQTLSRISQSIIQAEKEFSEGKAASHETKQKLEKSENHFEESKKTKSTELADKVAFEILCLMISSVGCDEKFDFKNLDFSRLQNFQGLIMHFSNFEGILADSLRAICYVRPEVMKKKKTVEWEEILSLKSWQDIIDMLTEKFVYDLGWQSLEERVNTFRTLFGLELNFSEDEIAVLKKVELIRNLIVHNAGKVNADYLKLEPSEKLQIGDYVPFDKEFLEHVSRTLQSIAANIYLQISIKYFGKKKHEANTCILFRKKRS